MSLLAVAGANSSVGGYDIDNSLKFEADNSEYMVRTMTSTGNRKTFTLSVWLKRTELKAGAADAFGHTFFLGGNGGSGAAVQLRFSTSTTNPDSLEFRIEGGSANYTNRVFRDTSAWYHIVFAVDTTQATSSDRIKLYVNGVQETSFSAISYPSQNTDTQNNFSQSSTYGQEIGAYNSAGTYYGKFCGYLAEYNHVDGQQLAPTEFGEFDEDSGVWIPKAYDGTYGTNGFYLDFEDSSSLGTDDSGNSNNFTLTNITAADQATDTPTNNFCTMNVILNGAATKCSFTEGATFVTGAFSNTDWESRFGSFAVESGKWYMELKADGAKNTNNIFVGFCGTEWHGYHSGNHLVFGAQEGALAIYSHNGDIYGGTGVHGFRIYDEDIVAMMLDADNGAMYFKRLAGANNLQVSEGTVTWSTDGTNTADPTSGASKTGAQLVDWVGATIPAFSLSNNVGGIELNFGGYNIISNTQSYSDANGYGSFVMQPPSGYYALCTKNLAEYG